MGNGDFPDLTAFILAGGKSTRMGADKAFVILDGQTLLARALELAHSVTRDVHIVGDPPNFSSFAPFLEDVFPDCGPLGGIHAALRASPTDLNLILAVDTPLVSPALLRYLITRSKNSPAAAVTLVRTNEGSQPLCAVYRRAFADAAEEALHAGRYKIDPLFTSAQTQVIEENELRNAGFSLGMFRNLNTQEEVAIAVGEIKSHEGITSEFKSPRRFTPDDSQTAPYIEFKNVYKAFGDNVVLDHVSFDIPGTETCTICGRSGVPTSVSHHD